MCAIAQVKFKLREWKYETGLIHVRLSTMLSRCLVFNNGKSSCHPFCPECVRDGKSIMREFAALAVKSQRLFVPASCGTKASVAVSLWATWVETAVGRGDGGEACRFHSFDRLRGVCHRMRSMIADSRARCRSSRSPRSGEGCRRTVQQ